MLKQYNTLNIQSFLVISFVFFMSLFCATELPCKESLTEIELLKKISSNYIKQIIESSKNLNEAAAKAGIAEDELKRICHTLSIDIGFYDEEIDPFTLPSVQKLSSVEYEPDVIVEFNGDSPYILLVEKSVHKIYLLKYENREKTLIGVFDCKTGKNRGDKKEVGDHKTPEGIFFLVTKYSRNNIRSMVGKDNAYQYGEMAFTTNFPNHIDQLNGKNGGGIWLHGTDEIFPATSSLDTRGCVVTTNETIRTLSKYIELQKTPLIIVETLKFNKKKDYIAQKHELLAILEDWRSAWEEKRIDDYINYYSASFRRDGRNRSQYKSYKANEIFKNVKINHIKLDNIILLKHNDGMIAKFVQDYSASNLSVKNVKTLYFVKANNLWGIIAEKFGNN